MKKYSTIGLNLQVEGRSDLTFLPLSLGTGIPTALPSLKQPLGEVPNLPMSN